MSEKKIKKCPWCESINISAITNMVQSGKVVERRCENCNSILAAYAAGEGDFLPKIRVF
jgi:phage FluMu protein Com